MSQKSKLEKALRKLGVTAERGYVKRSQVKKVLTSFEEANVSRYDLKKDLRSLGIKVIKGNFVKRSDVEKILNRVKAGVPSSNNPPVTVDCTYEEIFAGKPHKTYAPDTYYIGFDKLPKCIQDEFEKVEPEIDDSKYTVGETTAFLRVGVITKDKAELDMEIHLGKLSDDEDEESEEGEETDKDEIYKNLADEMKATFDWRMQDVYFEVMAEPEPIYEFIVDMDERGVFSCHVEDPNGKIIWSASTEDEEDGEFWPTRDGFMKHTKDMRGLEKYLQQMEIMPKEGRLIKGQ